MSHYQSLHWMMAWPEWAARLRSVARTARALTLVC